MTEGAGGPKGPVAGADWQLTPPSEEAAGATLQVLRVIQHQSGVAAISWGADSRLLATSTETGAGAPSLVRVWDAASGQCLAHVILSPTTLVNAAVPIGLLDGRGAVAVPARLALPTGPMALLMWSFRGGAPLRSLPFPSDVDPGRRAASTVIAASPDQRLISLVSSTARGSELLVYRVGSWDLQSRIAANQRLLIRDFRFSRDGTRVVMAVENLNAPAPTHHVMIATPMLGAPQIVLASPDPPIVSVAFSGDGRYLVTGADWVRDGRSHRVSLVAIGEYPSARRTDLDGVSPPLQIWDATAGRQLAAIEGPDTGTIDVDWSPDGRMIAAAFRDHSVRVWRWPSRAVALMARPSGRTVPALCARFSPDGRMLAICVRNSLVILGVQ